MVEPGNLMPFCAGMDGTGAFFSFDRQAGRPALLLLCPGAGTTGPAIATLAAATAELALLGCDILLLASLGRGRSAVAVPTVTVPDDGFFRRCGAPEGRLTAILIDRASRVVGRWRDDDPASIGPAVLTLVRGLAALPSYDPPLLHVPGVLEPALCLALIARFDAGASFDSGLSFTGPDGRATSRVDHARKSRRDLLLEPDDPLHDRLLARLRERLFPSIRGAFHHEVEFLDRVVLARYDAAARGHFGRHRDNAAAATVFRRFATSLNLDAAAHDGGDLVFPEFSDRRFRPATGAGLVFSASLLHEVTPVTRGTRYALLTFVHDKAAEDQRRAHAEPLASSAGGAAAAA